MVAFKEHAIVDEPVEPRQALSGGNPTQQSFHCLTTLVPLQHGSGQKLYLAQLNGIVSFALRS